MNSTVWPAVSPILPLKTVIYWPFGSSVTDGCLTEALRLGLKSLPSLYSMPSALKADGPETLSVNIDCLLVLIDFISMSC